MEKGRYWVFRETNTKKCRMFLDSDCDGLSAEALERWICEDKYEFIGCFRLKNNYKRLREFLTYNKDKSTEEIRDYLRTQFLN